MMIETFNRILCETRRDDFEANARCEQPRGTSSGSMIVATTGKIQPFVWISRLTSGKADKIRQFARWKRALVTRNFNRGKISASLSSCFLYNVRGVPAGYFL